MNGDRVPSLPHSLLITRYRHWATSSLIAGVVWIFLALAPIPFTTLLGLPFAGYAIVVGGLSLRHSLRAGDGTGAWRGGGGMGLGCMGFIYLLVFYTVVTAVLWAAITSLLQRTP